MSMENRHKKSVNGMNRKDWILKQLPSSRVAHLPKDFSGDGCWMRVHCHHQDPGFRHLRDYSDMGYYVIIDDRKSVHSFNFYLGWNESLDIDPDQFFYLCRPSYLFYLSKKDMDYINTLHQTLSL